MGGSEKNVRGESVGRKMLKGENDKEKQINSENFERGKA